MVGEALCLGDGPLQYLLQLGVALLIGGDGQGGEETADAGEQRKQARPRQAGTR